MAQKKKSNLKLWVWMGIIAVSLSMLGSGVEGFLSVLRIVILFVLIYPIVLWEKWLRSWGGGRWLPEQFQDYWPEQGKGAALVFTVLSWAIWAAGIWLVSWPLRMAESGWELAPLILIAGSLLLSLLFWMAGNLRNKWGRLAQWSTRWAGKVVIGLMLIVLPMGLSADYKIQVHGYNPWGTWIVMMWTIVPLAITVTLLAVGYRLSQKGLLHEVESAQARLDENAQICVLAGVALQDANLKKAQLAPWFLDLDGVNSDQPLIYDSQWVLASYELLHYRLLDPGSSADRRLVLLLDEGNNVFPRQGRKVLQRLKEQDWKIYAVGTPESCERWKYLTDGIVTAIYPEEKAQAQRAWARGRLRPKSDKQDEILAILNALEKDLGWEPRLNFLRLVIQDLTANCDEVECFYQMLKAMEYIIHYRALFMCGPRGKEDVLFPNAPAFGSLEQAQRKWSCGSEWAGHTPEERASFDTALQTLGEATTDQTKDKGEERYNPLCSRLSNIYNTYVGHGTLAYRVNPDLALALVVLGDRMIRDFQAQTERLEGSDRAWVKPLKKGGDPIACKSCLMKGESYSLLSFVSSDGQGGYWAEYLDYATGELTYEARQERISFQMDYGVQEEAVL